MSGRLLGPGRLIGGGRKLGVTANVEEVVPEPTITGEKLMTDVVTSTG